MFKNINKIVKTVGHWLWIHYFQTFTIWKTDRKLAWYWYPLWFLIKAVWEPFSRKRSHFFMWDKKTLTKEHLEKCPPLTILGNPLAEARGDPWSNFQLTNFGWKQTVKIRPDPKEKAIDYVVAFTREYDGVTMYSMLVMRGSSALLLGPEDINIYGLTPGTHEPVKLMIVHNSVGVHKKELGIVVLQ